MDAHKNFAVSTVATAPSPASSGTSLVVASGHGTRFPAVPFNATVYPSDSQPDPSNAEIVRVTNISTDTFTITRTEESTSARAIVVGDIIAATITAKTLTDVETEIANHLSGTSDAHEGSAISLADAKGNYAGTDVEAGLEEAAIIRVMVKVLPDTTVLSTGDGKASFPIDASLNGCNLIDCDAFVVGASSSGTPTIQLRRVRSASPVDMLSTAITIDVSELDSTTAATGPTINTSNDDVATGDRIFIDVDVAGTGTDGLDVLMIFARP